MRNTLILLVLISLGLTSPALANERRGERNYKNNHPVEQDYRKYARHDRGDRYGRFEKRMDRLRKELRHERRQNRHLKRREVRRQQQVADRRMYRDWRRPVPTLGPRHHYRSVFFPRIVVHIPLNW